MAIRRKELGNQRGQVERAFRALYRDGRGGLAFRAFAEGWQSAWKECLEQRVIELAAQAKEIERLRRALEEIVKDQIYMETPNSRPCCIAEQALKPQERSEV